MTDAIAAAADLKASAPAAPQEPRSLAWRYMLWLIALVGVLLILTSGLNAWLSYRQASEAAARLQDDKADAAAQRIAEFIAEIERQIGWTTHVQWDFGTVEQRRLDYIRLLRQVPAISELVQLDREGKEQLKVSRLSVDVVGSGQDYSADPRFTEALASRVRFSPVYFRKESEPFLSLSVARGGRQPGVTIAEVNLKLIWDVVNTIRIGETGYAYAVDGKGRLIAHPDISQVLRNSDLSAAPQVRAALARIEGRPDSAEGAVVSGHDLQNRAVLAAYATIPKLKWAVFVEQPAREALAPLYAALLRNLGLLAVGLAVAALAAYALARRMVVPIQELSASAARLGAGDLAHRVEPRQGSGAEIAALAKNFNFMGARLQESYAGLEAKVEARTQELARSIGELRALAEVGRAVSSTLDLRLVLDTIVTHAVGLAGAEAGAIYRYRRSSEAFWLAGMTGGDHFPDEIAQDMFGGRTAIGKALASREPIQIPDMVTLPHYPLRDRTLAAGFRAVLVTPLVFGERVHGMLVLQRRAAGSFEASVVEAMQAFATQSAIAIQNARLFREVEEKGRQLEIASQHKSQFLANMSHELRTPLNAILGYAELMADGIYGDLPDRPREVLARIQANGKHLLGLINDVLDLSKIEAGQFDLRLERYAIRTLVDAAITAAEPLATAKGLSLAVDVADGLPVGLGDTQRLAQVLLNLVGNSIKFTERGGVTLTCRFDGGRFHVAVADTGSGIATEDQATIFEEFKQVDNSSTRNKGGTGLGLAISRRIARLHGGDITLSSELGVGSVFTLVVPVEAEPLEEAA